MRHLAAAASGAGTTGRVVVYIDGFNLYNGLKDKHGHKYMRLDLQALAGALLLPGQKLVSVRYFTARVRRKPDSARRQSTYIDALKAHCSLVTVIEGGFQEKSITCWNCHRTRQSYEEKETDVSIAVALVEDASLDRYDSAIVVSADSDLCPAVRAVRRIAPSKRLIAAFPPRRVSEELRRTAHGSLPISDAKFRRSLLPERVDGLGDIRLSRPERWR
jgi:uncharacterized LabA/DUF88 family protein